MMIRLMYFCKIVFICCYLFSDKFNAIWSFKVTNADKQICAKILYETWWNFDRRDVYLDRCIFVISFISRDFVYLTIMKYIWSTIVFYWFYKFSSCSVFQSEPEIWCDTQKFPFVLEFIWLLPFSCNPHVNTYLMYINNDSTCSVY